MKKIYETPKSTVVELALESEISVLSGSNKLDNDENGDAGVRETNFDGWDD